MKKVITYGTYDLLHQGHINLLKRAKALGDWLIVGVTTDKFDLERGKMNSYNNLMERIEAVKATGYADQIIIEEYKGQKIDDIQKYGVDIFAIGSDWEGYFDYLKEYCEVVYLPRTEGISSTLLRGEQPSIKVSILGPEQDRERFIDEARQVNSIEICPDSDACDAVYIASPAVRHFTDVKDALQKGKHVLCEPPLVFETKQAEELFRMAEEKNLVLMLAHESAYCPAFGHLISMLKSGVIGDIADVAASVNAFSEGQDERAGGSMGQYACLPLLPIFKLLGTHYRKATFYSRMKDGVDVYSKSILTYDNAVASFHVGTGVKSEGALTICGTKGYAYVPAPWWRTEYFELHFEDKRLDKKCFYPYMGEGLRYEIKDFVTAILQGSFQKISHHEILMMTDILERYMNGENVQRLQ